MKTGDFLYRLKKFLKTFCYEICESQSTNSFYINSYRFSDHTNRDNCPIIFEFDVEETAKYCRKTLKKMYLENDIKISHYFKIKQFINVLENKHDAQIEASYLAKRTKRKNKEIARNIAYKLSHTQYAKLISKEENARYIQQYLAKVNCSSL